MLSLSQSSGDLLADRRFEYARAYEADGDVAAAVDLFTQAVERVPGWAAGWFGLGEARAKNGDVAGAAAAFRAALTIEPQDSLGAGLRLAVLGAATPPPAPPEPYVRALFDDYAPRFEKALVGDLGYRTPGQLARMLAGAGPVRRLRRAIDLGCGTGLMGAALAEAGIASGRLDGVDLSPAMIEEARAKALYGTLHVAEMTAHLAEGGEAYDLVLAADVFVYLGDLEPVLAAAAARLAPGGRLAFSVEGPEEGDTPSGWVLKPSLRYGHDPAYIRSLSRGLGLDVLAERGTVLRLDRGAPVQGRLFLTGRPSEDDAGT